MDSYKQGALVCAVAATLSGMGIGAAIAAPITPGNILAYRLGDGLDAPTSKATVGRIDEYTPAGIFVQTFTTPGSGSTALTTSGNAPTEGQLNLSADGKHLLFAGFRRNEGLTSGNSSSAASVNRVVGRLSLDGTMDTSTTLTGAFNSSSIRGVASLDGNQFWVAGTARNGTATGLIYVDPAGTTTATGAATLRTSDLRSVEIFGGDLYISSTNRIDRVEGGLPTSGTPLVTSVVAAPGGQSWQGFVMFDLDAGVAGVDTLYAIDGSSGGKLNKFSLVGETWTSNGSLTGSPSLNIDGAVDALGNVTLYTTSGAGINQLVDTSGYNAAPTGAFSALTTGFGSSVVRGIVVVPVPEPTMLGFAAVAAGGLLVRRRRSTQA